MHPSFISAASVMNNGGLPRLTNQTGYRQIDEETCATLLASRIDKVEADTSAALPIDMPAVRAALNMVLQKIDEAAGDVFLHPTHADHHSLASVQGSVVLAQWGIFVNSHAYSAALNNWFEANHQNCDEKAQASLSVHNLEFGKKIGIEAHDWATISPAELKQRLDAHLLSVRVDWLAQAFWLLWIESLPFTGLEVLRQANTSDKPRHA
jgi:hypothetical protein